MDNPIINYYIIFMIFVIGLCLGSFYNVVILRSLSGESIVYPPSKCPKCGNKLKPWHNIPILSYILLRGKCAYCKEKISIQYPIVELITGLTFLGVYLKFGLSYITLFVIFCLSCMIIMTVTDLKEKIVDCNYAIGMVVCGIIYAFYVAGIYGVKNSILGALLGFAIIELVARIGFLFKKGRAMGEADSYVAAAIGAAVGCYDIGQVLLYSLFASMFFVLPKFWYNRYKEKDALTLLFSALFILSIAISIVFRQNYFALAFLVIIGIALSVMIIKQVKNVTNLTYLPFVPALSAGFLYYLFFVV